MDLFDLNNNFSSFDEIKESEQSVLIWTKKVRKTINTYMTGWDVDLATLKKYHSQFKKQLACNGSLKRTKFLVEFMTNQEKLMKEQERM